MLDYVLWLCFMLDIVLTESIEILLHCCSAVNLIFASYKSFYALINSYSLCILFLLIGDALTLDYILVFLMH